MHSAASASENDAITTYTLLLTIFTGVLAIATILLYIVTKKAADAATKSADVAEKTSERHLRAYISMRGLAANPGDRSHPSPFVQVKIENHGQTPAHDCDIEVALEALPYPLPLDHDFPTVRPQGRKTTLHPRESMQAGANTGPLSDQDRVAG